MSAVNDSAIASIIIVCVFFPLLPFFHIMARRLKKSGILFAIAMYIAVWVLTGFWLRHGRFFTVDYILAGGGFIGFFVLGYLEFFSMLCRGFSLQLLVDVYVKGAASKEDIIAHYGGKGIDWMFTKRIATMQSLGFVAWDGATLTLRSRGALVGRIGLFVKRVLRMGQGG